MLSARSFSVIGLGFGMMIFGFILAGINKVVFKARTKQLEIDT